MPQKQGWDLPQPGSLLIGVILSLWEIKLPSHTSGSSQQRWEIRAKGCWLLLAVSSEDLEDRPLWEATSAITLTGVSCALSSQPQPEISQMCLLPRAQPLQTWLHHPEWERILSGDRGASLRDGLTSGPHYQLPQQPPQVGFFPGGDKRDEGLFCSHRPQFGVWSAGDERVLGILLSALEVCQRHRASTWGRVSPLEKQSWVSSCSSHTIWGVSRCLWKLYQPVRKALALDKHSHSSQACPEPPAWPDRVWEQGWARL